MTFRSLSLELTGTVNRSRSPYSWRQGWMSARRQRGLVMRRDPLAGGALITGLSEQTK